MDKFRAMEVFVAVVEHGSFTTAAEQLGMSSVMVGKYIIGLEHHLTMRLLHRTTRKQALTEAGQEYFRQCKQILDQVRWAEQSLESRQVHPRGMLRVSAPVSYGSAVIAPALVGYQDRYPDVQIELVLSNQRVDLLEDGYDLAIRIGPVVDERLVARKVDHYHMRVCAAPGYLKRFGTPMHPADLAAHRCLGHLVWTSAQGLWPTGSPHDVFRWPDNPRFASNDGRALINAALAGAGIVYQPSVTVAPYLQTGQLVSILEAYLPESRPVRVLYLPDSRRRPKLDSVIDYLAQELPPRASTGG